MPNSIGASKTAPVALTIAGFDTSAGAGLQADLLTFHNHGYHCLTASTSLVVETPLQVRCARSVPGDLLNQQVELLLATYPVSTIKVGLVASPNQVLLLSEILGGQTLPIVLDPVGISSTGTDLQKAGTFEMLRKHLAPLATVITPNLPEARLLLGEAAELSPEQVAIKLAEQCGTNILLTGGHHGEDSQICDLLVENGQATTFCDSKIESPASLHGTGCVLSSALAANLGRGNSLSTAVQNARSYLRKALTSHLSFPHPTPLLALNHHQSPPHCDEA